MPVNAKNHLERHQGILQREEEQVPVGQGNPLACQGADEFTFLTPVIVDEDPEIFLRSVKAEVKLEIEIGERGDIEVLYGP